jgi:hypothetical protein
MLSGFGLGSPMPLYHAQLGRVNPGWKTEPRPTTRAARSSSRVRGSAAASDTDIEQKVSTKEETANKAKGGKTGVLFQIHFFTDDLFSKIIGKPTFGG